MKPFIACTAIFSLIAAPIQAQRTIHGVVFNDANGNGVLDRNERPVPGVVVSNQLDVVTTDAAGRYRLPADEKTIVFVSVPTDWQTVGSSWHTVASSDSIGPALTLLAGDLIYDSMSQQEPRARGFFELFFAEMKLRAPYWTVPGNHDHFGIIQSRSHVPETHPLYNRGMYRLYMGPEYYSFNYGGVHFIGLDTVQPDDSAYYGGVDSLQLAWLTRDVAALPASTPIVMFSHIPLASGLESMAGYLDMALVSSVAHPKTGTTFRHMGANTLAVLEAFKGHSLPLILGGHTHVPEKLVFQTDRGPLRFEQSAAIVGPNDYGPIIMPSGFSLYTVTNGAIDAGTFVPLKMPKP